MIRATAMANSTRRTTNDNARGVHQPRARFAPLWGMQPPWAPRHSDCDTTTLITCAPTQGHITRPRRRLTRPARFELAVRRAGFEAELDRPRVAPVLALVRLKNRSG